MSRVLFITSDYPENGKGNLYYDLVSEFVYNDNTVDVIVPQERKYKKKNIMLKSNNLTVLRVRYLNFRGKVSVIEKGIATLIQGYFYKWIIKKYFKNKYDIVICATLPISYRPVFQYVKKKYNTYTYLLHKDIFPQSAIDLGILKHKSVTYKFFRRMESRLYDKSDKIGVMSKKNIEYLLLNNPRQSIEKFEICVNSIIPKAVHEITKLKESREITREKYHLPVKDVIFIYGGNISRAQGIQFIYSLLPEFSKLIGAHLLFVGSGNEFDNLKNNIIENKYENITIISKVEKSEFDLIVSTCDVGLVFLDHKFTIANIPSRSLTHMEFRQPIIAATDEYTDFREFIVHNNIGLWSPSNDVSAFIENVKKYMNDNSLIEKHGDNARVYLENNMNTKISYLTIMKNLHKVGNLHEE